MIPYPIFLPLHGGQHLQGNQAGIYYATLFLFLALFGIFLFCKWLYCEVRFRIKCKKTKDKILAELNTSRWIYLSEEEGWHYFDWGNKSHKEDNKHEKD